MNRVVIGIVAALLVIGVAGFTLLGGEDSTSVETADVTSDPTSTPAEQAEATATPVDDAGDDSAFTAAAVATHSSEADCWTIIGDKVYDITQYLPRHPGGEQNILDACGTDGTALFEGQQAASTGDTNEHGSVAENQLSGFLLGQLQ